jgi:predicted secreted protein
MPTIKCFLNLFILISSLIFAPVQPGYAQQTNNKFNADAVWNPSIDDMGNITIKCGLLKGEDLYSCLISEMQSANASDRAIEFTKLLDGRGYMKAFKPSGTVDIAVVYYPFNKENHDGYVIVNCSPALVDADNYGLLNLDELEKESGYIQLENKYPRISLCAGDRTGANYPLIDNLPNNGERIIVNYALRDGCNSCELIGYVEFGFDFDSTGNFLGTEFLTLKKSVVLDSVAFENRNPNNVFSDPSQTIVISQGDEFVIALQSNHSAGLKWELAEPLDEKVVTLLGSNFVIPNETLPNAAGKETWNFRATGKGGTGIIFKYVRDWQNETKEYQNITFTLMVN